MTRAIATIAVLTGIPPNDLMDTDFEMIDAMVEVLNERARYGAGS